MKIRRSAASTAALILLAISQSACGGGGGAAAAPSTPTTPTTPVTVTAPAVYFSAEANGIGDPNPYYENGTYSVVYLKNEGRHPFWMTQTSDAVSWTAPALTLAVGATTDADSWIGSGSVIADPSGGYRLFYTGHNPDANPVEVVMQARATSLSGPWTKVAGFELVGAPAYDSTDFRDPFVFWNSEANAYWMILASRVSGQAVIARYSSPDLSTWTAEAPLYTENSPLNLEVPDLFQQCGRWNLLYSDQRSEYRQVRLLTAAQSSGTYTRGNYDALDGKAFYAGKTAGTDTNRLLFGWLAHKVGHTDAGAFDWGGDMITHAVSCNADGNLAVHLPDAISQKFTVDKATLSTGALAIGDGATATFTHLDIRVTPGDEFGISFRNKTSQVDSQLKIDTANGQATFLLNGSTANAPSVAFPPASDGHYTLDLVVDPKLGLGVAYINAFRALSFRFYGVKDTNISVYTKAIPQALTGTVRERPAG